jgi:putative oxidoreductase
MKYQILLANMSGIIEKALNKYCVICQTDARTGSDTFYAVFRIIFGLMFFQYGLQKIFGLLGGVGGSGQSVPELVSLVGLAGLIELFAGLAIALGVFTRLAALISTLEMLIAYLVSHSPNGFFPILNGGVPALLFFAAFMLITKHGAGKWSLERRMLGKETF